MIILALDSCYTKLSVAISNHKQLIASKSDFEFLSQSENLVPAIESILSESGLKYEDIDYLALTCGPGSFTGVRVGLACASAIKFAMSLHIISTSTLEVVAHKMINQSASFNYYIVVLNASNQESYIQIFDQTNHALSEIEIIDNSKIIEYIENKSTILKLDARQSIAIGGSGLYKIYDSIMQYNKGIIKGLPRFPNPEAKTICSRAYELIKKGYFISELNPIYIRKPYAKIGPSAKLI